LYRKAFCPICPVFPLFAQGIAFANEAPPYGANRLDRFREDAIFRSNPSQGNAGFDLLYVSGALLRASTARGTKPYIFTFYLRETECGLSDNLAHGKGSNLIPRANNIAQSALKTSLKGVSAACLYDIYDFFIFGYILHNLPSSVSSPFLINPEPQNPETLNL